MSPRVLAVMEEPMLLVGTVAALPFSHDRAPRSVLEWCPVKLLLGSTSPRLSCAFATPSYSRSSPNEWRPADAI